MALPGFVQVTEEEVIKTHLFAEQKQRILDALNNPTLNDKTQNETRRSMLVTSFRGGIYQPLFQQAEGIAWHKGTLDPTKFQQLRLIPSTDWFVLSLGTLKLSVTATNFYEARKLISQTHPDHLRTVDDYEKNLVKIDLTLIAISTEPGGEFTVIDGVKRSVATYLSWFIRKTLPAFPPVRCYLGLCKKKTQIHAP